MGRLTDARFQTRQMMVAGFDTNNDINSPLVTIKFATQVLVREVSAALKVAGTTTSTHALIVLKATDSIGSIAVGTDSIGAVIAASLTDTTFAAGASLIVKTTDSDASMKGHLLVDYNELFSAT